jgi:hypothetical protein
MKTIFIALLALFFLPISTKCDDFKIDIYYLSGEKSKDSHSKEEVIAINGYYASYSSTYSRQGNDTVTNEGANRTLSEVNLEKIKRTIAEKQLNVNDSLFEKESKYKSFELFCNIKIDITLDGQSYKIRINGDTKQFDDKELYKNSVYFISFLRNMIKNQ